MKTFKCNVEVYKGDWIAITSPTKTKLLLNITWPTAKTLDISEKLFVIKLRAKCKKEWPNKNSVDLTENELNKFKEMFYKYETVWTPRKV